MPPPRIEALCDRASAPTNTKPLKGYFRHLEARKILENHLQSNLEIETPGGAGCTLPRRSQMGDPSSGGSFYCMIALSDELTHLLGLFLFEEDGEYFFLA